jgi:ABC-type multidrug transport system fused ATPase/permease subunit
MKKIIEIIFIVYKYPKTQIIKFVSFSLLATLLEVVSVGAVYPFISSIFYNNNNILKIFSFSLDDKLFVIILCILLILIFFLKNAYTSFFIYWQNSFIYNTYAKTSLTLLKNYLSEKYNFFYMTNSAVIVNNIYSETRGFAFVVGSFLKLLSETFILIAVLSFLFYFQPYITFYLFLTLVIFLFFYKKFIKKYFNFLGEERIKYINLMLKELKVIFDGIKTIKIMNKEDYFYSEYKKYIKNYSNSAIIHSTFSDIPRVIFELISIILISFFIIYNSISNIDLQNTIPVLAVFIVAAFRILPGFNRILSSYQNIVYSYATINTIYDRIQKKLNVSISDKNNIQILNFNKSINISNLNFNYEGSNSNFFQNLNLSIYKNDFIGIIGESGSGKSTLINLISCLHKFNNGYVKIDNTQIDTDYKINLWQKKIGYVSQVAFIKEGTVKNNVAFGIEVDKIDDERVIKAMKNAELEVFLNKIKYNLNLIINDNGLNLSLGEQQRFGIARALYLQSDLFILDEPTSSLDKETEEKFINFLEKFSNIKTIILVSHKSSNMRLCNKIFKIEQINNHREIIQIK